MVPGLVPHIRGVADVAGECGEVGRFQGEEVTFDEPCTSQVAGIIAGLDGTRVDVNPNNGLRKPATGQRRKSLPGQLQEH